MKKIAVILMILCVGFAYAQNDNKTKYEQKGDLVEENYTVLGPTLIQQVKK